MGRAPTWSPEELRKLREPATETARYEVLSDRCVHGKQGEVVKLTLTAEQESSLVEGGHLRRK